MTKTPAKKMIETAQEMCVAIKAIVKKRSIGASESQYDRKVCILAVGAAGDAINRVPVTGMAIEYCQAVTAILNDLQDSYNDPDGEYTSGKGSIGGVYYDVLGLLDSQLSIKHGPIDKNEARRIIVTKMAEIADSFYDTKGAPDGAPIKITVQGASGTPYFLKITFEATSDREFTMRGQVYSDDSCQYLIMEDRSEFISNDD